MIAMDPMRADRARWSLVLPSFQIPPKLWGQSHGSLPLKRIRKRKGTKTSVRRHSLAGFSVAEKSAEALAPIPVRKSNTYLAAIPARYEDANLVGTQVLEGSLDYHLAAVK